MTDSELLKDYISKRDENAFAQIVLRYERLVWSVCHRLLLNHSDREDAFQETFLVLAKSAHRIRKPDSMSSWLYGVTWKTASRMRKRRSNVSLDEYIERGHDFPESGETSLDRIARLNEFELVNRHLQTMPDKHRTPLILFYFAGLTAKQIADRLNLTVTATEGRLRRARSSLKKLSRGSLNPNGDSEGGLPVAQGATSLLLAAAVNFKSCPELMASTVRNSFSTTASVSTGVTSGVLNSGAKIMICKLACAAGISAIMAIAGVMHSGPSSTDNNGQVAQLVLQQAQSNDDDGAEFVLANEEACCDGKSWIVCDAIHSHLDAFHDSVSIHAVKLCQLMGCCETNSTDEE